MLIVCLRFASAELSHHALFRYCFAAVAVQSWLAPAAGSSVFDQRVYRTPCCNNPFDMLSAGVAAADEAAADMTDSPKVNEGVAGSSGTDAAAAER
jgi:hypothetical protein